MDMANNHSLTVDKNSPQVSESSAPVVKVLAANIHMLLSEDIGSLIVTEDIPRSKATEETVKQAGMCSEEDENQHHGTIQTFYKLLEIYYKLFGGRMESDENITQFSTWQQNIIPKMKDILKYYCSKISKCKTDSTEDEMSDVQQKSTGQCHDMLENVEKIFEDEFNSEEMENYVGTQDQITLSDFNEMLEKCCDQMYGDTCENELEISKKGASERQKGNAALKNIEATTRNTGSIENQKNNDVKKAASLRKKHKDSRVNNKPSRKQLETSEKMDSKQEMATSIKQIYGSSRRKAGANKEEPEGDMCNAYKPESNISPSVKTASVQPKARTRPKTEPDRSTSNGGYPRTIRRNTNLEVRWRLLSPYLDKSELKSSLAERPCIHSEYKSRLTANKIVEPHISYKMDHMIPDLLTEQLNNWNKRDKIHTKKPANRSAGSKRTDSRVVKLKKTPHYFDEENNSDYLATRRTFYDLQLDLLKFENQFQQSAMESVLNEYLGHSKGSHAAIKELTDYYCH